MSSRYSSCYAWQDNDSPFKLLEFHPYSPEFENKELGEYSHDVIYIAEQENSGFFHYEHWKKGALLRRLKYNSDYGWISADGEPEQWENSILFSEEQLTMTIDGYGQELRGEIDAAWQRRLIKEGDIFPPPGFADFIGLLRTYWNLFHISRIL